MFYSFCPTATEANCGGSISLEASPTTQSYSFTGPVYDPSLNRSEACYYEISTPTYEFKTGAVINLKFTEIGSGSDVTLRAS